MALMVKWNDPENVMEDFARWLMQDDGKFTKFLLLDNWLTINFDTSVAESNSE